MLLRSPLARGGNPRFFAKHVSCFENRVSVQRDSLLWTREEISHLVSHSGQAEKTLDNSREPGCAGQRREGADSIRVCRESPPPRRGRQGSAAGSVHAAARPRFAGKLLFVEDYDINVGRYLVQGVDVWLNTPRCPLEASGTSGLKVVLNGGLNLSILDGWWADAYDGQNGFAIGHGETHSSIELHDATRCGSAGRRASRRGDSALLRPRPRRPAAEMDRADETRHPNSRLAVQRRSNAD
jgi:hypothetical protein